MPWWGRGLLGLAAASALVAVPSACEAPQRMGLPVMVNVVVRLEDGEYASLMVDLDAPHIRPGLRVARGLVSYNGQQLLELAPSVLSAPGPGARHQLEVGDLLRSTSFTVQVAEGAVGSGPLEVVHMRERQALLRLEDDQGEERFWEVGLYSGELEELGDARASQRFERYGPERGFAVYMADDEVMLALPHGQQGEAMALLDHVAGVVSVSWIAEEYFPSSGLEVLERRFKMAGSVIAMAQPCTPDGDLREWSKDQALSVGTASHVESGLGSWENARDASFALAARLAPHELCVAVRVRDAEILPQQDHIVILTELQRFVLPVPAAPSTVQQPGLTAAFTDQASFGIGLELCLAPSTWTVKDGNIPFRVQYHDADPQQETTVIASAPDIPWPSLAGVRLPRRAQDGALPPRD